MQCPRVERWPAIAMTVALALAGCATMQVSSYVERAADFGQYRTYDWGPAESRATGDPRLDNNTFFRDHLQGAVNRQLAARGLERTPSRAPDLLVYYHTNVQQRVEAGSTDQGVGSCHDCAPYVYQAGTLMLDLVDTRSHRVVWRGWARDTVDGLIDDQDRMEQKIDEAVRRILATLPPTYRARPTS